MPGSAWSIARQRDYRGGETQALLPEEIGQNQLIRMENAMIYPNGWLTAAPQAETAVVTGATLGMAIVPLTNGTYNVYSADGTSVYAKFLETSITAAISLTDATPLVGARIVGLHRAVSFLGKWYCPNPNSDDTKDGILNLSDIELINVASSDSATASKLRVYTNRLWLILSDGKMRISDNGDASTWNPLNVVLLPNSEPIMDFHPVQGGAIVYGSSSIYAMYGSSYSDITLIPLMLGKHFSTGSVEVGGTVFILSTEGIYAVTLNGAQLIPHKQQAYFQSCYKFLSDDTKTISAIYIERFKAIIFSWPDSYGVGISSLVFYVSGAYSKLGWALPAQYPHIIAVNDANTDYLIYKSNGDIAKSEYPSVDFLASAQAILQTRHEDYGSNRDKVWSELVVTTNEVSYGVTISAVLDYSDTPILVAENYICSKGDNTFWLDDIPRSKTISFLLTINGISITATIVSDDDNSTILTDGSGNELVASLNPGNWTIQEMRVRFRLAGPDL